MTSGFLTLEIPSKKDILCGKSRIPYVLLLPLFFFGMHCLRWCVGAIERQRFVSYIKHPLD
jgi:hypothetical protein